MSCSFLIFDLAVLADIKNRHLADEDITDVLHFISPAQLYWQSSHATKVLHIRFLPSFRASSPQHNLGTCSQKCHSWIYESSPNVLPWNSNRANGGAKTWRTIRKQYIVCILFIDFIGTVHSPATSLAVYCYILTSTRCRHKTRLISGYNRNLRRVRCVALCN